MTEVPITLIEPREGEIKLQDARMNGSPYLVPVTYQLADGYYVEHFKRVFGSYEYARAWWAGLPQEPEYPTRAVFNEHDELETVITTMVPISA